MSTVTLAARHAARRVPREHDPAPVGALYDYEANYDADGHVFPKTQPYNRTYGMDTLSQVFRDTNKRLFEGSMTEVYEFGQAVIIPTWVATAMAYQLSTTPGRIAHVHELEEQLSEDLKEVSKFVIACGSAVPQHKQQMLTYMQQRRFEYVQALLEDPHTAKEIQFADLLLAGIVNLCTRMVPVFVPEGGEFPQPRMGGVPPIPPEHLAGLRKHYTDWFTKLHKIAARLSATLQKMQVLRPEGAAPIINVLTEGGWTEDMKWDVERRLWFTERRLGTAPGGRLFRLANGPQADTDKSLEKWNADHTHALWWEMRDKEYRAGLPGEGVVVPRNNRGGGDCFYAALLQGIGLDGSNPDFSSETTSYAKTNRARRRIRQELAGPTSYKEKVLSNPSYRRMVKARRLQLNIGQLDHFAEILDPGRKSLGTIANERGLRVSYPQHVPISQGREPGELMTSVARRQQAWISSGKRGPPPVAGREPEDYDEYNARVDAAYQSYLDTTLIGFSDPGAAYWAGTFDIQAAASVYERRIHVYTIVNARPYDPTEIRFYDHVESYGDPSHRVLCLAWVRSGRNGNEWRTSRPEPFDPLTAPVNASNVHYVVLVSATDGHPELNERTVPRMPDRISERVPPPPSAAAAAAPRPPPPPPRPQPPPPFERSPTKAERDAAAMRAARLAFLGLRSESPTPPSSGDVEMGDASAPPPAPPSAPAPAPLPRPRDVPTSQMDQAELQARRKAVDAATAARKAQIDSDSKRLGKRPAYRMSSGPP